MLVELGSSSTNLVEDQASKRYLRARNLRSLASSLANRTSRSVAEERMGKHVLSASGKVEFWRSTDKFYSHSGGFVHRKLKKNEGMKIKVELQTIYNGAMAKEMFCRDRP